MVDETRLPSVQEQIRAAVRLREADDVDGARVLLARLWPEVEHGDAFDRLFFAHSFADVQTSPDEELRWDLIALDALGGVTEDRAADQGVHGGVAGLRPSLHLNLAYSYARVGDMDSAHDHYRLALSDVDALDHESYGQSIRQALMDYAAEYPASD